MSQLSLPRVLSLTTLTAIGVAVLALSPNHQASSTPAGSEAGPMPRLAEPAPLFAEIVPAKNPVRMCLQDDGRKVLGWISGTIDYEGMPVRVRVDDKNVAR